MLIYRKRAQKRGFSIANQIKIRSFKKGIFSLKFSLTSQREIAFHIYLHVHPNSVIIRIKLLSSGLDYW